MSLLREFKEFAMRGNVIDLAVGVVIGAAFGKITSAIVANIIMPPLGLIVANMNFRNLKWVIQSAEGDQPEVAIAYGEFIQATVDFIVIAFVIFLFIKLINSFRRKEAENPTVPPAPTKEELLLTEIRDLLKTNR